MYWIYLKLAKLKTFNWNLLLHCWKHHAEEKAFSIFSWTSIHERTCFTQNFHSTKRLIDVLYAIHDSGEFVHTYTEIWNPEELEPQPEHHGNNASLLNLETNILGENLVNNHLAKGIPFHFLMRGCPLSTLRKLMMFFILNLLVKHLDWESKTDH